MKIILFNGPPSSGKDTAALTIWNNFSPVCWGRMSMPIKRAFAGTTSTVLDGFGNNLVYEAKKEQIIPAFDCSYRQWQINFSEKYMKPLYGEDIFAKLLCNEILDQEQIDRTDENIYVIPDCGFAIEVNKLYRTFRPEDILFIRCHRAGTNFSKDSRGYVHIPAIGKLMSAVELDCYNDKSIEDFQAQILKVCSAWLTKQGYQSPKPNLSSDQNLVPED